MPAPHASQVRAGVGEEGVVWRPITLSACKPAAKRKAAGAPAPGSRSQGGQSGDETARGGEVLRTKMFEDLCRIPSTDKRKTKNLKVLGSRRALFGSRRAL